MACASVKVHAITVLGSAGSGVPRRAEPVTVPAGSGVERARTASNVASSIPAALSPISVNRARVGIGYQPSFSSMTCRIQSRTSGGTKSICAMPSGSGPVSTNTSRDT